MGSYLNLYIFNILFLTACRNVELASSSARCDRSPKILHARQGEIRSPTHYTWSLHPLNCSWLIPAAVGERVILSFSQFSMRCGRDWVSVTSQTGYPISLCGSQLPRPVELTGGNITVTHHFLQRMYPLSGFSLEYIRDSGPCFPGEFECYSERCLPASWRCNGQVECLGEEDEMGSDEEDCDYDSGLRPRVEATSADLATTARTVTEPELHAGAGDVSQQGTCGGLLQKFYGSFWPLVLSGPAMECVWTVDPQDLRPLRLELQLLELGPGDTITITNQPNGTGGHLKTITCTSNYKVVEVESRTGKLSLTYRTQPGSEGRGFNATYRIADYCLPWEELCRGSEGGCYTRKQRCDGHWDCVETGLDEEGCGGCPAGQFPCGGTQRSSHFGVQTGCFSAKERCNYQLNCADGSDERDCTICRPGTFHCDSDRCVFESWRCDGQVDCKDGTDELNCTVTLPRKVITAATVGSLVCGLLLVIAMGCTCKLYSLRTREYSMFAPITRQEAEMIQQQAPPSYGQLIAQGIIPPVEDFPTENPNETSSLSLRGILQLLRQDGAASPRRRRRPRFVRRAVRRLRRWGFLPRPVSRPSQTTSSTSQQTEASPAGSEPSQSSPEGSSLARESVSQTLPQKLCMLPQTEQQQPAEPPVPPPSPPTAALPPITNSEMPQTPTTAVLPNSPSLASIFHSLGLSISLFRPSSSSPTSLQLSSSPSFSSSSSDDEVLLIPLSDDTTSEDDVPMLT